MKRFVMLSLLLGILLASLVGAAENDSKMSQTGARVVQKDGYGPPWACPLYPILVLEYGTVYYADRFGTNDCINPSAAYLIGDYQWPAECYGECETATKRKENAQPARTGMPETIPKNPGRNFEGLPEYVGENYVHNHEMVGVPGQKIGASRFPGGPARICCTAYEHPRLKFIRAYPFGRDQAPMHAKVLKIEFDKDRAKGLKPGTTKVETFVAFELQHGPSGNDVKEIPDEDVSPVWSRETHAYCAKYLLDGNPITILVLLAK